MSYAGPASHATKRRRLSAKSTPTADASRSPADSAKSASMDRLRSRALERANQSRNPNAAFLAGIALGALVGAGVALLLAPQAGFETRRSLMRGGRRLTTRGRDAWDDLRVELRRAMRRRRRAKLEGATSAP